MNAAQSLNLCSPQAPSELITRGQAVQGTGMVTVGPMNFDMAVRGKCLAQLLKEVGELTEVVPAVEVASTKNAEFPLKTHKLMSTSYTPSIHLPSIASN